MASFVRRESVDIGDVGRSPKQEEPPYGLHTPSLETVLHMIPEIALLAGIMLPALWIYIRSLLNTSVHTKKELKAGVNIPFLGEVPLEKNKHEKDIVVQEGSRESICEAFKIVRDDLDFIKFPHRLVEFNVLIL